MLNNATEQLTEVDVIVKEQTSEQKSVSALVENTLNGVLKGINTFRTKRAETAEVFNTKAKEALDTMVGKEYASYTFESKRSGVKEMGIYISSKVTLTLQNGETVNLSLNSKMKTWNQSNEAQEGKVVTTEEKELVAA